MTRPTCAHRFDDGSTCTDPAVYVNFGADGLHEQPLCKVCGLDGMARLEVEEEES